MPHVFFSYARENVEFTRRAHAELLAQGQEVWVDWKDIPPSAEWPAELNRAIEAADAVLFIISPDSVASKPCLNEIRHAIANKKRIITLLYADAMLPAEVSAIQWIDFRSAEGFAAAIGQLRASIDVDLAQVRAHTRLQVRALEWEAQGHNASLLLRGSDLVAAEAALRAPRGAGPETTDAQIAFVLASRAHATTRLRQVLGATTAALILMAVLSVATYLFYRRSNERGQIALSRELAVRSLQLRQHAPDQSLLIAVEANRVKATQQARDALIDGLRAQPRLLGFLHGQAQAVAFSPDGGSLLAIDAGGTLTRWDVARQTPELGRSLALGESCTQLAFLNDKQTVVASCDSGFLSWRDRPGAPVEKISGSGGEQLLAISGNGRIALVSKAPAEGAEVKLQFARSDNGKAVRAPDGSGDTPRHRRRIHS